MSADKDTRIYANLVKPVDDIARKDERSFTFTVNKIVRKHLKQSNKQPRRKKEGK